MADDAARPAAPAVVHATGTLVVGSGLAGLYAALAAAERGPVAIVTRGLLRDSSSWWAQGGIAAALGEDDTVELHEADTLRVGRGLCDPAAVSALVEEAPAHVRRLRALGVDFDHLDEVLQLGLEAGHSRRRVAHAGGGATGRVIMKIVAARVLEHPGITILDGTPAWGLVLDDDGACRGVHVPDGIVVAAATVLATGGMASLYARSTNPPGSRGQGLAMAWRAGAEVIDLEFVQFHPTALALPGVGDGFLISEAVRGEGAHLLDADGVRFMRDRHPEAELAPRDELARAVTSHLRSRGDTAAYLSVAHLPSSLVLDRFASIAARLADLGFDFARDPIPVAPAAHYTMGGVRTDAWARTAVPGLLACGEVACTGVHGANRLASNSLLECLVFADRAGRVATEATADRDPAVQAPGLGAARPPAPMRPPTSPTLQHTRERMWRDVGVVRDADSLAAMLELAPGALDDPAGAPGVPVDILVAMLAARGALVRHESRGGHWRSDAPAESPDWLAHVVQRAGHDPGCVPHPLVQAPAVVP